MFESYTNEGSLQFSDKDGQISMICGPLFSLSASSSFSVNKDDAFWMQLGIGALVCIYSQSTIGLSRKLWYQHGTAVSNFRRAVKSGINLESGYLDIFDSKGNLTWSAASARRIPIVLGVISLQKEDVINGTATFSIPNDCYILSQPNLYERLSIWETYGLFLGRNASGSYFLKGEYSGDYLLKQLLVNGLPQQILLPYAKMND